MFNKVGQLMICLITMSLHLTEIEGYSLDDKSSLRTKRLTLCNCKPELVDCNCIFRSKDSRKCSCLKRGVEIQQRQRSCRCTDTGNMLWDYCKNSCQGRCFESCLNSDSGIKCLKQCGPLCFDACSDVVLRQNVRPIKLIVQTRSQCDSGCSESCSLSCKNQEISNQPSCKKACQKACQKTCNALAPDDSELDDYDLCRSSCLVSCRNSCLSQPGQNLLINECDNECKRTCDQVCSIEQNRRIIAFMMSNKPPQILVPNQLNENEIPNQLNENEILYRINNDKIVPNTNTKSANFNSCFKHCSELCANMGYSSTLTSKCPELCYQTCLEKQALTGFSDLSGCRASCPASCEKYCEQRQIHEQDACKNECNKACTLACGAEIIDTFNRKVKEMQHDAKKTQLKLDKTSVGSSDLTVRHNKSTVNDEISNKKLKLRTKISIFPHNRTMILQCQIRCAKYCVENYGGDQCISDCQQSCLDAALEKASEKNLVTTINIGGLQNDSRKPQILPCNLGAKPTGENCICANGYTQCGVNQCCKK